MTFVHHSLALAGPEARRKCNPTMSPEGGAEQEGGGHTWQTALKVYHRFGFGLWVQMLVLLVASCVFWTSNFLNTVTSFIKFIEF